MLRVFLTIVLPLLLPTLVWIGYMAVERRRLATAGGAPRSWSAAPWPWLAGLGVVLMVGTLALVGSVGSGDPGEVYVPAHVGPDGRLVPGRTIPADKP